MKMFILSLVLTCIATASEKDWPTWRGPNGDGKLADDADYPTSWSATENLKWRIDLASPGNSSPIAVGGRVFITQAKNEGKTRSLLCFDAKDGSLKWEKAIGYGKKDQTHKTNPYCAASPVSDGEMVFAWFGNAGLFAYDLEGNEKWTRNLGSDYEHIWGPNAASPILHENRLIIHAGPGLAVGLFCLDKSNGDTLWEKKLPAATSETAKKFKGSWATPLLIKNAGRTEMLIGLPKLLRSFDPKTGAEFWRCRGLSDLCYTNAMAGDGRAIYMSGYGGPGIGVKLPKAGETGDLTETHRIWADDGKKRNRQRIGSGQLIGEHLFLLEEPGGMTCIDAKTGAKRWEDRLGRKSWSSMNLVGGKLYVNDKSGTTFVMEPNPAGLKIISANVPDKNQSTNSSLAFANGIIFLRTDAYLYAFGK